MKYFMVREINKCKNYLIQPRGRPRKSVALRSAPSGASTTDTSDQQSGRDDSPPVRNATGLCKKTKYNTDDWPTTADDTTKLDFMYSYFSEYSKEMLN